MAKTRFNAELVIAIAAMLTAVVATIVAVLQTQIMQEEAEVERAHARLSVMPAVTVLYSNGRSDDGVPFFKLNIFNQGLGPAVIKDFSIRWNNQSLENQRDWVRQVAGGQEAYAALAPSPAVNNSFVGNGRIIPAGENVVAIEVSHPSLPLALHEAYRDTRIDICACSFYGDCQRMSNTQPGSEAVATCEGYLEAEPIDSPFGYSD